MEWSPTSDSTAPAPKDASHRLQQEERSQAEDVTLVTQTPTDTEPGRHSRLAPIRERREHYPLTGSDRSPRNQQVAYRIGSGRNVLVLLELRQTEPFGWRTPLGEQTAIPVVCFFIVQSEICFHKYRKLD